MNAIPSWARALVRRFSAQQYWTNDTFLIDELANVLCEVDEETANVIADLWIATNKERPTPKDLRDLIAMKRRESEREELAKRRKDEGWTCFDDWKKRNPRKSIDDFIQAILDPNVKLDGSSTSVPLPEKKEMP